MRTIRDAACLLVAVGSTALAAWQPAFSERSEPGPSARVEMAPASPVQRVDDRTSRPVDRAAPMAPVVKA